MILHTVNKNSDCLSRCLAMASAEDVVLLIEDGVYAAMNTADNRQLWEQDSPASRHYVLAPDLAARGISDKILPLFNAVTWPEFVALSVECDKVISWS